MPQFSARRLTIHGNAVDKQNKLVTIVAGNEVVPLFCPDLLDKRGNLASKSRLTDNPDFAADAHAARTLIKVVGKKVEHQLIVATSFCEESPSGPEICCATAQANERRELISVE